MMAMRVMGPAFTAAALTSISASLSRRESERRSIAGESEAASGAFTFSRTQRASTVAISDLGAAGISMFRT